MSNLLKGGYISYQTDATRVIDSNDLVASKIEKLAALMQEENQEKEDFSDSFIAGLNASQVGELLDDPVDDVGEESGNVIKAEPVYEGPSPEEILAEARAEAQQLIDEAVAEAENNKTAVYEEARKSGYNDGYQAGLQEVEALKSDLAAKEEARKKYYEEQLEELEPMFIDTLTGIYEHIFHVQLADNKEIIFYLIQDAVRKVEGNKNFIIHVSKEDYGFVSMQKKELLSGVASAETAEIVEDMTLKQNECFIETGGGIFDCSLETQLAGLTRELKLLSYVKPIT